MSIFILIDFDLISMYINAEMSIFFSFRNYNRYKQEVQE